MTSLSDAPLHSDPGEVPVLDWIAVDMIDVDEMYQRPLDQQRVDVIAQTLSWRSFGALVVVPQKDGRYHATDGQHRLAAAKQHPTVTHVPAVIVQAEDVQAEAGIFVDINKNRKNVTALELFFAQLTAGDAEAESILQVCQGAGVRIPKFMGKGFKANDCVSIAAIQACVSKRGAAKTREILALLTKASFAPISASHIKATEMLLHDPEFAPYVSVEALTNTVRSEGVTSAAEAKRFAATHKVPFWKGLANVWFQQMKKTRPAVGRAA